MSTPPVCNIFVIGPPRCGTTLIAGILNRSDKVLAPGETHFFEEVCSRMNSTGSAPAADAIERVMGLYRKHNFPMAQELVDTYISAEGLREECGNRLAADTLYRCFTARLASAQNARFFCDDTPKHLFYYDLIRRCFPDAPIIGCIRDPRAFLCSYKNKFRRSDEPQRIQALYHPVLTSLLWRTSASQLAHLKDRADPLFMLLPYENLVANPRDTVARLCRFIGIAYTDSMLAVDSENSSHGPAQKSGIFTTSVDRWRNELGSEEIWWSERLNGSAMARFGYKAENRQTPVGPVLRTGITTPFALCKALYANRDKTGSLPSYIIRRTSHLIRSFFRR